MCPRAVSLPTHSAIKSTQSHSLQMADFSPWGLLARLCKFGILRFIEPSYSSQDIQVMSIHSLSFRMLRKSCRHRRMAQSEFGTLSCSRRGGKWMGGGWKEGMMERRDDGCWVLGAEGERLFWTPVPFRHTRNTLVVGKCSMIDFSNFVHGDE